MKHGRIAMAATLGMLVQENYHFTGYLSPSKELLFSDVPNGLAALNVVVPRLAGNASITLF